MIDPARAATETDLAALEYAATVLSVELARLHSVAEAELRGQADREREVAEARAAVLAASEARQRAILEAALDAVVSIDQDARVTYVNSAFERTFGYRAEEVTGRDLAETIVPPSLREAHRHGLARHLETGQASILDRRDGDAGHARRRQPSFPPRSPSPAPACPAGGVHRLRARHHRPPAGGSRSSWRRAARVVAASDAARQRVTRDLHDGAQQRLVTTLISLQLAEQSWESAPQRAQGTARPALR